MNTFRKVLVPLDFSAHSSEALRYAAELSRRFEAPLTLVHAYDPLAYAYPDGFLFVPQPELDRLFEAIDEQLAAQKKVALEAGATSVDTKVLRGHTVSEIVGFAERGAYDLIVMGTHGRTGVQHLLMGSVAERVVRTAACAVLTVKGGRGAKKG